MGLTCMPDSIRLDLAVRQVQGVVSLARMSNPLCLDLALRQVQNGVGLARMPDPLCLNLVVCQVQDNYHPLLACLKSDQPPLGLTSGKNSVYIGLATLDVLNSIFPTLFLVYKSSSKTHHILIR
jgi:hypothetical protein